MIYREDQPDRRGSRGERVRIHVVRARRGHADGNHSSSHSHRETLGAGRGAQDDGLGGAGEIAQRVWAGVAVLFVIALVAALLFASLVLLVPLILAVMAFVVVVRVLRWFRRGGRAGDNHGSTRPGGMGSYYQQSNGNGSQREAGGEIIDVEARDISSKQ